MNKCFGLALLLLAISACTITTSRSSEDASDIESVCIVENAEVKVANLVSVIESRIATHGVKSQVVSSVQNCVHTLEYAAVESGDVEPYLDFARFTFRQNGKLVNTVKYRDKGGPPEKRSASLSSKIDPIIDELLGVETTDG